MVGVFFAVSAVLLHEKFFLDIRFILAGVVIAAFADGANQSQQHAVFFLCHIGELYMKNPFGNKRGVNDT